MASKKSDPKKTYDWEVWPQAYFDLAIIGCDWLLNELLNKEYAHSKGSEAHKSIQFADYTILPIVHNFKHGIELYLKALSILVGGEYEGSNHDLITLLNILIVKINGKKQTTKRDEVLKILDEDLRSIIERYYFGTYLSNNRYKARPDVNNQAERYPETNAYQIPEPLLCWRAMSLSKEKPTNKIDVEQIKNDIIKLYGDKNKYGILRKIGADLSSNRL